VSDPDKKKARKRAKKRKRRELGDALEKDSREKKKRKR
jgi:hypothetical protein